MMSQPLFAFLVVILLAGAGWWLFRPEYGLWHRWRKVGRYPARVRREDALKFLYDCQFGGRTPALVNVAGALHLTANETAELLLSMEKEGLILSERGQIRLSPIGRSSALHIIRAHRLWERYLADETGFPEAEWHKQADRVEHILSPARTDALAEKLGHPTYDPHGDPIPTAGGEIFSREDRPLSTVRVDGVVRIVHLEDEPDVVYAQLVAAGLHPGMVLRVAESTPQRVCVLSRDNEHVLAPMVAGNVFVVPLPADAELPSDGREALSTLTLGESAEVAGLSPACRGVERRRFLDLGITPGTMIKAELRSPGGDPTAYQIRGALIALRREQAELIEIKTNGARERERA